MRSFLIYIISCLSLLFLLFSESIIVFSKEAMKEPSDVNIVASKLKKIIDDKKSEIKELQESIYKRVQDINIKTSESIISAKQTASKLYESSVTKISRNIGERDQTTNFNLKRKDADGQDSKMQQTLEAHKVDDNLIEEINNMVQQS